MKRTPLQTKRLWALVDLMKYDTDPERFDMRLLDHPCGAPACLIGHFLAAYPTKLSGNELFGTNNEEWAYLFSGLYPNRERDTGSIAASRVIDVIEGGS